ncbi:MAG: hypothetical protein GW772_10005 [Flavobacteriia bacterium]|nr:hypothetical protein [Flavobacteriia bacterium]OIP46552.1 MAG: hypothetical protein AUK46_08410 [Flavobacteriaceae bacterium CG2_30_31_66]PIV96493.1 MAG: hypothetical protein COW43_08255 [Flavobacteriaceae bacterium CG17_big_fil_post_rev_8_21_14_2_50_31_13]PIX14739.1 MAG: hypothetical protein COZ74_02050 [Flavobacteriaceae bacterium CG_4_8_14_3_um_filter_31_8]PIY15115.1 MAG: hypothetical protein COZ16_05910 [Flavobacteriaceae bacterium CG_4_10_14_3_um_filter_31_253]PIZ09754.1 MAG: hypotheti
MMHVFHFYKKLARFPKSVYSTEIRNSFSKWESQLISHSGFIHDEQLFLPEIVRENTQLNRIQSFIIQDVIHQNYSEKNLLIERETTKILPELFTFNKENNVWNFEIFSIEKTNFGEFELMLKYDTNKSYIGEPNRNDHKLCSLKKGEPVQVSINGKTDFSLTGRRERTYTEYGYIIEYLGDVSKVDFIAPNKIEFVRKIPAKSSKVIDLRKVLY